MSDQTDKLSFDPKDDAEAARRFWKLWQKGSPPDLEQFLQGAGALTPVRLAAVLCVDLRERWKRQQRLPPEDYLKRFPQLDAEREAALDVVYCEFLLRDEQGEAPTATEYMGRFPRLATELKRQIDMHRLLQADEEEIASLKTGTVVSPERGRSEKTIHEVPDRVRHSRPLAFRPPGSKTWPAIPGYEILDRLGRGGMGVVYKAWQEKLHRVVAIKMVQAETGDSEQALARFRIEAEAIARLHHANILQVYEVGEHEGRPYLVMEYADAGSLAQKTDGTPWPAKEAAQMIETLARAVQYAHQRGVLHRDLTPGNVLLFADGTPKLCDFGLAKLLVGGSSVTQTGAVVGTPSYMSPEQARGSSHDAGPAVDVYALGAILFEMITGRPPFRAATPLETLALVAHADPISPRQLQPSVPRDLETICVKCLRKEPGRRYASAAELADDLKHFLNGEPILARPVGNVERLWRWGRRNPGWATALILLFLTAVGAVGAAYFLHRSLRSSERAKLETSHKLFHSYVDQARAKRLSGRAGQRCLSLVLLDDARKLAEQLKLPPGRFHELRNEVIASLALPDMELVCEWDGYPASTYGLDFDDGMTLYARGDMQGNVIVRRMPRRLSDARVVHDDGEAASIRGEGKPVQLQFSPEARFLALSSEGKLRVFELAADKIVSLDVPANVPSHSFGPQARTLAILHGDGLTISVYDTKENVEVHKSVQDKAIVQLAFHPHLDVLALAGDKEAILFDWKNRTIIERIPHPDKVMSLSWSPNGRVLATGCADKFLRTFEVGVNARKHLAGDAERLRGIRPLSQVFNHSIVGMKIMLNRDGTVLAGTNSFKNLRLWDARNGQPLVMPLAEGGHFRFAANDDLLACTAADGKLRLYRAIAGREFRRLPDFKRFTRAPFRAVVFHPTGSLLFAAGQDGLVSIDIDKMEAQAHPLGNWTIPIAFDSQRALITESATGYESWPSLQDAAHPRLIRFGPPRKLAEARKAREKEMHTAFGPGSMLAIPYLDEGARLVWPNEPAHKPGPARPAKPPLVLGPQKDVRYCAISPNGLWVATGTYEAPGRPAAVIWDARTGERLREIPFPALPRICEVGFSPDSRWLITAGGGCRLWDTATWQPSSVVGGGYFAFAPNGSMLAVEGAEGQVRLVDPATGTEFACLTAPNELHSFPACFNDDGSLLAVYGSESQSLHVWDLRAVRQRLRENGLDWELPPFPDAVAGPSHVDMVEG